MDSEIEVQLDQWFAQEAGELRELIEILDISSQANAEELDSGQFALPPDDSMFEPECFESVERFSQNRYDALVGGAKPSGEELAYWRERYEEDIRASDGPVWTLYIIWKFAFRNKEFFLVTFQGDGGVIEESKGLFESVDEALSCLEGNIF